MCPNFVDPDPKNLLKAWVLDPVSLNLALRSARFVWGPNRPHKHEDPTNNISRDSDLDPKVGPKLGSL